MKTEDKEWICKYRTVMGMVTLASDGTSITGMWFEGQKYYASTLGETVKKDLPVFQETKKWLDIYFSGKQPDFIPPLSPKGTDFQKMVWQILSAIPYRHLMTYGQIAKMIADKQGKARMSAQAVGRAVGHNPISILIPCHRVLGSNGSLTGYAGGVDKKNRLLELEGIDMKYWKLFLAVV